MGIWNYRIVRTDGNNYGIHEVYYDAEGNPKAFTEKAWGGFLHLEINSGDHSSAAVKYSIGHGVDMMVRDIPMISQSLTRPIIDWTSGEPVEVEE